MLLYSHCVFVGSVFLGLSCCFFKIYPGRAFIILSYAKSLLLQTYTKDVLAQCRGDNEVGLAPVNLKYLIKTFAEPNQVILMCTFNNTANEIECKVQRVPPGS